MAKKKFNLIFKNIIWRILLFLCLLLIANMVFFIRDENVSALFKINFNLIVIGLFLAINIIDFLIIAIFKNSESKFAQWIFINKFFSWQTVSWSKYLSTTKQNKFLVINRSFFSAPLWAPFIQIPIGIVMIYTPLFIFGITTLLATNWSLFNSLTIFAAIICLTLIIANIWLKSCNDGFKETSVIYNLIQDKIDKTKIDDHNSRSNRETWTSGWLKIFIMLLALMFFTFSLLGFAIATKTLFTEMSNNLKDYPYWQNWALFIFIVDAWKNAIFIVIWPMLLFLWFINLWIFIHTPWYLLMLWRKKYLNFNIITLNFIIIAFWSIRFDDEEKVFFPIRDTNKDKINSLENQNQNLATTSEIIDKKINDEPLKENEQIITRVIPLDMIDEDK